MMETNEGYTIIKREEYLTNEKRSDSVVLGYMDTRFGRQYVTWEKTTHAGTCKPDFYWGHYFTGKTAETDALTDYHKRLMNHYELRGQA